MYFFTIQICILKIYKYIINIINICTFSGNAIKHNKHTYFAARGKYSRYLSSSGYQIDILQLSEKYWRGYFQDIPGIQGVDTRALTKLIREKVKRERVKKEKRKGEKRKEKRWPNWSKKRWDWQNSTPAPRCVFTDTLSRGQCWASFWLKGMPLTCPGLTQTPSTWSPRSPSRWSPPPSPLSSSSP